MATDTRRTQTHKGAESILVPESVDIRNQHSERMSLGVRVVVVVEGVPHNQHRHELLRNSE